MLTSLNRLLGMPVIWQDRQMGCVERAVADGRKQRLSGLVVRRGIGAARWTECADVALLGENSVVLRHKPGRMPEKTAPEMRCVFLTSGECAGAVTDVLLDGNSLQIRALEVCQSPLQRLMGQRSYAVRFRFGESPKQDGVVAAQLLSWAQLKAHLEGEEEE